MAGRYGMSFAKDLIEQGDYEEAIVAATRAIEEGEAGPEPLFDRGTANELAEHFDAAVTDFEAAIAKNRAAKELDPFMLDDAYFSALLAAARHDAEADVGRGVTRLDRYAKTIPDGAHLKDVSDWQKRLRGELPSLLDKTKELNAP
jgi:tetratricopeptide (TPR) repeat protein